MKSEYCVIKRDKHQTSRWSGGTTTELCIYPVNSSYADRNFIWRISSAEVEEEESVFTSLPCYNRILMILKGSLKLIHEGQEPVYMTEYSLDTFDGGIKTVSQGRVTDYNLMMRKDKCEGTVELITMNPESTLTDYCEETVHPQYTNITDVYYNIGSKIAISVDESKKIVLDKGDVLVVNKDNAGQTSLFDAWNPQTEEAIIIKAKIYY